MITKPLFKAPIPHRFLRGARADAPLLVPLVPQRRDSQAMIRLCRRICPGGPLFLPDIAFISGGVETMFEPETATVENLAALIGSILHIQDLTLTPVVIVGHGSGADLTVRLATRAAALLTACVLLKPTRRISPLAPAVLNGLSVLLEHAASEEVFGSVAWQIRHAMLEAGAHVVSVQVSNRRTLARCDATYARVFISSLFGLSS